MRVRVEVVHGSVVETPCDALVVNLFQGVTAPGGATGAVDQALGGVIRQAVADGELRGRLKEALVVPTYGRLPARRVLVAGLGPREQFSLDRVRQAAAHAARAARRAGSRQVASIVHGAGVGGLEPEAAAQATVEGTVLGLYRFRELKTTGDEEGDQADVTGFTLVERDPGRLEAIRRGAERGRRYAEATCLARDLMNRPANLMTPAALAEAARAMAAETGLECEVLDENDLARMGMGAFLGVAQGSAQPPRLILLRYRPRDARHTLALVGKALTFDSGGLSLKGAERMEEMKFDMGGGAAVLGAMRLVAQEQPAVNVLGVVAAAENMPGGRAQRPGDVVRAMNGRTIEVTNTDAEGRLVLADAVAYARSQGADWIVDVATLTGACVVALGHVNGGLVSNNEALADAVIAAGRDAGEGIWAFPTNPEYKELLKSDVADYKNSAGRNAGAISGGLFIGAFAEDTPWAHVDIAGTAWTTTDLPYHPKGGTGFGVRTLANLALRLGRA